MLGEVAVLEVQKVWKLIGWMVAVVVGVRVRRGRGKSSFMGERLGSR